MPSLIGADAGSGVNVAANYNAMPSQQSYGIGEKYTNFGTRQLSIIKVAVSGGTNDMRYADGSSGADYTAAGSLFAKAVRALQTYAEVYAVYAPVAGGFLAVVALDTANSSDSGNGDTDGAIGTGYGLVEAVIAASLNSSATVAVTTPTIAIGTTL
jgi:hypothetical protein